jgi:hypothetical protein
VPHGSPGNGLHRHHHRRARSCAPTARTTGGACRGSASCIPTALSRPGRRRHHAWQPRRRHRHGQFYQNPAQTVYAGSNRLAYGTIDEQQHPAHRWQRLHDVVQHRHLDVDVPPPSSSGNGTMTAVGLELANNYNMTMPTAAPISRPFGLTWNSGTGDEHWARAVHTTVTRRRCSRPTTRTRRAPARGS